MIGRKSATQIKLRLAPEVKRQLEEAAKRNGRSQNEEVELRLRRSFDRGDLIRLLAERGFI